MMTRQTHAFAVGSVTLSSPSAPHRATTTSIFASTRRSGLINDSHSVAVRYLCIYRCSCCRRGARRVGASDAARGPVLAAIALKVDVISSTDDASNGDVDNSFARVAPSPRSNAPCCPMRRRPSQICLQWSFAMAWKALSACVPLTAARKPAWARYRASMRLTVDEGRLQADVDNRLSMTEEQQML